MSDTATEKKDAMAPRSIRFDIADLDAADKLKISISFIAREALKAEISKRIKALTAKKERTQ